MEKLIFIISAGIVLYLFIKKIISNKEELEEEEDMKEWLREKKAKRKAKGKNNRSNTEDRTDVPIQPFEKRLLAAPIDDSKGDSTRNLPPL